ncbi:metalloregulator ArsR/SmtB family transcription factor [Lachnospiraceae bacterium OttesenSCG-928-E19]|nr:metalloregulator ArsR/SmtB family transcription factor [Lachnospiraceae bacterium OttesenSCG-928-E19]
MKKQELECCDTCHIHTEVTERMKKNMADEDKLRDLADLFKIFGDATRVRILCVLQEQEMCVCDLADVLGMTQSAISHQLRTLKQAKLVKNRREGKTVFYSLADGHIQTILSQGMEHIME